MHIAHTILLIVALVFISISVYAREISLEDYLDWETASDPQISPDGKLVLYVRSSVDKIQDKINREIWAIDAKSGEHYRLMVNASTVRWSPTGDSIAYIGGDGQIYVRRMQAPETDSRVTTNINRATQVEWTPDGESLVFRAEVPASSSWRIEMPKRPAGAKWVDEPAIVDRLHFRRDRFGPLTGFQHLFVVPADGGTPRQVTYGEWNVGAQYSAIDRSNRFSISPDSNSVIFSGIAEETEQLHFRSDINVVDLNTGALRKLTEDGAFRTTPRISPNGKLVAYIGGIADGYNQPETNLHIVGIDGTKDRILIEDLPAHVSRLFWDEHSLGVFYSVNHDGRTNLFYASLKGKQRQVTNGKHRFHLSSISKNGVAAGVYSDPVTSQNIAFANIKNGKIELATNLNDDILHDVELGKIEELKYPSSDGFEIQGWLIKPANYSSDKKYPLILYIHGGPEGMYGVDFNLRFQHAAAQGYLVLYVNPRGSSGYGREFMQAINHNFPGEGDYEDLMAGVDFLISRGIVDANQMYVSGCSGGGALTAWIVTKTDRFAAAASLCTITNWISFMGQTDVAYWGATRFSKPYWEDPSPWLEHSPIMHVANVSTPTLLMTGDKDLRTPIAQAEEFYTALKMRGVDTKLISMKGEYHGVWSIPSNFIRAELYQHKWFREHQKVGVNVQAQSED